jgi:hypothetical protein
MSLFSVEGIPLFVKSTELGVETHIAIQYINSASYDGTANKTTINTIDGNSIVFNTPTDVLYNNIIGAMTKILLANQK